MLMKNALHRCEANTNPYKNIGYKKKENIGFSRARMRRRYYMTFTSQKL